MKKLTSFAILYDERLENITTNNRVVKNIDAAISEPEEIIEIKLDIITADNTKMFNSFVMKPSYFTSN